MKLFVTGATGFVGSHVLREVLKRGHEVTAVRRHVSKPRVGDPPEINWIVKALDELSEVDVRGHEVLVHLAAHTANVPYGTLEQCLYWNHEVALRLVRACARADVHRFVIAGTCFEYGKSGERYQFIPNTAPLEPTLSYPISKAVSSIALLGWARLEKKSMSYHRIFQVFGEGEQESRLWPSLRAAALAGRDYPMTPGEQVRDFTPVELVASHFADELERPAPPFGDPVIRHVAAGNPCTTKGFAEYWWRKWGATGHLLPGALPYRLGEVMRYVPELTPCT